MPIRKTLFVENHYYHIYNQGVERRSIFQDETDYHNFIDILAYYLKKTDTPPQGAMSRTGLANVGLFETEISLICFALTPKAFHLLLHQQHKDSISRFMSRVGTAYSMNFNNRYNRVGSLFQGRFRAKHIDTFDYLLESTKYIHRLPHQTDPKIPLPDLVNYPYSSFRRYRQHEQPDLKLEHPLEASIKPDDILQHFHSNRPGLNYFAFVSDPQYPDWFLPLLSWIK